MKKTVGTFIASVALLTALPLAAHAADENGSTQQATTAEIELTQDPEDKDIVLTSVPDLNFGTKVNSNETKTYDATGTLKDVKVKNPGNVDGWDVQVKRSEFTSDKSSLKAATLSLKNGEVIADDTANASKSPAVTSIDVNTSAQSLLTAEAGEGIGAFSLKHNNADVTLNIPAGNVAGSYKATLTWTLANAPTGTPTATN